MASTEKTMWRGLKAAFVLLAITMFWAVFFYGPARAIHPDLRLIYGIVLPDYFPLWSFVTTTWLIGAGFILWVCGSVGREMLAEARWLPRNRMWMLGSIYALGLGLASAGTGVVSLAVGFSMYSAVEGMDFAPQGGSTSLPEVTLFLGGAALAAAAVASMLVCALPRRKTAY